MRHLAAYLLLVAGGNSSPSAADITTLLATVGVETSEERLTQLLSELEGKDVNELIALGREKLVSTGGGAAPAAAGNYFVNHFTLCNICWLSDYL